MRKALVSLSGGMDSAVLLALAIERYGSDQVGAISFTYGSKHNQYENEAARQLVQHYHIGGYQLIDLSPIMRNFRSDLMLSGDAIPDGHYEAASMSRTVVPGRNLIFISVLTGLAWSEKYEEVWIGAHAGDHFIYPDCRPDFLAAAARAVNLGSDGRVSLRFPFQCDSKTDLVRIGLRLGVPFGLTRTCYKHQEIACGKCGSCNERREAFQLNEATDPIPYETTDPIPAKPVTA